MCICLGCIFDASQFLMLPIVELLGPGGTNEESLRNFCYVVEI